MSEPFQSGAGILTISLGHGVFLHLDQAPDGQWEWVRWYRWRTVDNRTEEGTPLPPPTEEQRRRRFATAEEAAEYFRELLPNSKPSRS